MGNSFQVQNCYRVRWKRIATALVREAVTKKSEAIARFPSTAAALREDVWPGRQLDYTLERLSMAGWRYFYDGVLGRTIADFVRAKDVFVLEVRGGTS